MTIPTSQDIAELRKLRDNDRFRLDDNGVFGPVVNEACKDALTRVLTLLESLANAEGHARALHYVARNYFESKSYQNACKAGALALTERPALIAEVERLQSSTQRCLAVMKDMQQCPPPEHSQHAPWLKLWFSRINETINSVEACAALKESHNG